MAQPDPALCQRLRDRAQAFALFPQSPNSLQRFLFLWDLHQAAVAIVLPAELRRPATVFATRLLRLLRLADARGDPVALERGEGRDDG
jgi:hypothetical protein